MCLMIFIYAIADAQAPDTLWMKRYGGPGYDGGNDIQPASDSGYIITGHFEIDGQEYWSLYLVRIDKNGDTLWTRVFGTEAELAVGYAVQQTPDGGYVAAGVRRLSGQYGQDIYVVKTDATGDTVWIKVFGGNEYNDVRAVIQTFDSGYMIAGGTMVGGLSHLYLIKTDANGDTIWTKKYGGPGYWAGAYAIRQTEDSGYVVAGYVKQEGTYAKAWLLKTDAYGDTLWTRRYGYDEFDTYAYAIQITSDDGYIMSGEAIYGYYDRFTYLIRTDNNGDTLWTRRYRGNFTFALQDDYGLGVQQTSDGGFVVVGSRTYSLDTFYETIDIYLLRTDTRGDTLWSTHYGYDEYFERGCAILVNADHSYTITGMQDADVYVLRTEPEETGIVDMPDQHQPLQHILVRPNPFSKLANIRYEIPQGVNSRQHAVGSIQIYDITGRLVRQWDYPTMRLSDHIIWDGTDTNGRALPSGVYFVKFEVGKHKATQKLLFVK